jgi:hypothetical protein
VLAQLNPYLFLLLVYGGSRPPTTNNYNDYIDSSPLHAIE